MSGTKAWFPLYVGDWLVDTAHLDGDETKAYLNLLCHSWRIGPLPDDPARLERLAAVGERGWQRVSAVVLGFFTRTEQGLVQTRLERERQRAANTLEQRKAAGAASAARRQRVEGDAGSLGEAEEPGSAPPPSNRRAPNKSRQNKGMGASAPPAANGEATGGPTEAPTNGATGGQRRGQQKAPQSQSQIETPSEGPADPLPEIPSSLRSDGALTARRAAGEASGGDDPPTDARTALFRDGLRIACDLSGKPPNKARAMLGLLLKEADDDCSLVYQVLVDAAGVRPADLVPWVLEAIRFRLRKGSRLPDYAPAVVEMLRAETKARQDAWYAAHPNVKRSPEEAPQP